MGCYRNLTLIDINKPMVKNVLLKVSEPVDSVSEGLLYKCKARLQHSDLALLKGRIATIVISPTQRIWKNRNQAQVCLHFLPSDAFSEAKSKTAEKSSIAFTTVSELDYHLELHPVIIRV